MQQINGAAFDKIADNKKVLIWVDESGMVNFQGPIEDKVWCLGVLEAAKFALVSAKAPQPIMKPSEQDMRRVLNNNGQ